MTVEIALARTKQERQVCYAIRHAVFVEEQGVPVELEIDEHDEGDAVHFLGTEHGDAIMTGRICLFGERAKIQRVAVSRHARGRGLGRDLMREMIRHIQSMRLATVICLDAQTQVVPFYQSLGFEQQGGEFDDAGIPHVHMRLEHVAGSFEELG